MKGKQNAFRIGYTSRTEVLSRTSFGCFPVITKILLIGYHNITDEGVQESKHNLRFLLCSTDQ